MAKKNLFASEKSGYESLYPVFSFRYYKESEFFKENDTESKKEFHRFFSRISGFSSMTWGKIKLSGSYHFHEIDNDKHINSKLKINQGISLVQFKLSGDKESRVVGYFDNDNVFNIVAYDYNHKIYPRK